MNITVRQSRLSDHLASEYSQVIYRLLPFSAFCTYSVVIIFLIVPSASSCSVFFMGCPPLSPHKQLFSITSANDIRPSVTKNLLNSLCQIIDIRSIQLLNKQLTWICMLECKNNHVHIGGADPKISSISPNLLNFQHSELKLTLAVIFHFFQSH